MVRIKKTHYTFSLILLLASALIPPAALAGTLWQSAASNPFGVTIGLPGTGPEQRTAIAKGLGAAYFRPADVSVQDWNGICAECSSLQLSGLNIVLTIRNTVNGNQPNRLPASPPTDLDAFEAKLGGILDKYHPYIVAIEDEENADSSYSGTPEQYGVELAVGCDVVHREGLLCTNGGMASAQLALLTWANYADAGKRQEACSFAQRAFPAPEARQLCLLPSSGSAPRIEQSIDKGKALLRIYKTSGLDYVNFHWYIADGRALGEAVAFLKGATGLPVITNEIGQLDSSPDTVRSLMEQVSGLGIPVAVWFSAERKGQGLVNPDGSLRANGQAFRAFIQAHYGARVTPVPSATPSIAAFQVGPPFSGYYSRVQGPRVLGPAIGPVLRDMQYFEKGRLEDHSATAQGDWAYSYGLLVPELIKERALARVAGGSGPRYAELTALVAPDKQVKAPGAARALVVNPDGSAFIPFDRFLQGDTGHIVLAYFWSYMNNKALFTAGWLHDVGLPMSEAFTINANKGGQTRHVTLQVFERTILSYDPLNPPDFRVERANTGLAYRDSFPGRVLGTQP